MCLGHPCQFIEQWIMFSGCTGTSRTAPIRSQVHINQFLSGAALLLEKCRHWTGGRSRAPVAVLALTAFGVSSAWLLPSAPRELPRRALLGAAASMVAPGLASAFGDVKMPMSNIRYKEVQCNPDKGEMLKGTRATYGLEPRCVEVTAEVTNPENKVLKKAGVFGKVNNVEEVTSVLANAMDGASDNGQFTLVEEIPPGTNDIQFRFVAALPKHRGPETGGGERCGGARRTKEKNRASPELHDPSLVGKKKQKSSLDRLLTCTHTQH
ncbi:unnamed protein product [Durusdinium trenchii]|uniref:Uncharacterized protein n=1 Tax=Durusdinium trenchii TaxID=1381693 RepID=A0ABP0LK92_9DINO